MSGAPTVAWLGGRIVPWSEARIPLEDRGLQFGESLYEVVMITASRPRLLPEHVARMRSGAEEVGLAEGVPSDTGWESIVRGLVERERLREGLLYAQVTGGAGPRSHVPTARLDPEFFAYVREHRFPRARDAERGAQVLTLPDLRWGRADLKTTMLLPAVLAKRAAEARGMEEALLLGPEGEVREGTTSNVFLVEGRRVVSPGQDHHLLPGITRSLVEKIATEAGLPVESARVPLERLLAADEVFLTSTSRLVLPVLEVDGLAVGPGTAGPVALDLARRMRGLLEIGEA
jgi:D-alanine transaminase